MGLVKEAKRWSIASLYNQCGTGRDYVLITGFWNYIRWAIEIWSPVKENAFILDSCWLIILNIQQNTMDVVSLKFDFWRNLLEIEHNISSTGDTEQKISSIGDTEQKISPIGDTEQKISSIGDTEQKISSTGDTEHKISSEFKSQRDYISKWHDFPKHHIYWYFFTLILCTTSQ